MSKREKEIVRGKIGGQKKKNSRNLVREKRMIVRGGKKKGRLVTSIVGINSKYVLLKVDILIIIYNCKN